MPVPARPEWAPDVVWLGDACCAFDTVAPITGDAIYRGHGRDDEPRKLALVPNPDARERQLAALRTVTR